MEGLIDGVLHRAPEDPAHRRGGPRAPDTAHHDLRGLGRGGPPAGRRRDGPGCGDRGRARSDVDCCVPSRRFGPPPTASPPGTIGTASPYRLRPSSPPWPATSTRWRRPWPPAERRDLCGRRRRGRPPQAPGRGPLPALPGRGGDIPPRIAGRRPDGGRCASRGATPAAVRRPRGGPGRRRRTTAASSGGPGSTRPGLHQPARQRPCSDTRGRRGVDPGRRRRSIRVR